MLGNYVKIHGKHLDSYRYSVGGGMTGGYYEVKVTKYENQALIKIESAEWHSQDPTVSEYRADIAILGEIEAVVRKYKMNFWNRKKFTNMFVHDGESTGYYFGFEDVTVSFSSQIYPPVYRDKLALIDEIVKKYIGAEQKEG